MRQGVRTALVLARRRVTDLAAGPGLYVVLSLSLLLGYLLVTAFVRAVDAAGFNLAGDPVYEIVGRVLTALFGAAFVDALFSEGPSLLVLYIGFLPIVIFLTVGSVFRLTFERKVGALDLLRCGPVTVRANVVAEIVTGVLAAMGGLAALALFSVAAAAVLNLAVGRSFFLNLALLPALSLSLYGLVALCFALFDSPASATLTYVAALALLVLLGVGSFARGGESARTALGAVRGIARWVSPLNCWLISVRAASAGRWLLFAAGCLLQLVVSGVYLFTADVALRARERRA